MVCFDFLIIRLVEPSHLENATDIEEKLRPIFNGSSIGKYNCYKCTQLNH